MPDLVSHTRGVVEMVVAQFARDLEGVLSAIVENKDTDIPQKDRRAAYEEVAQASPQEYDAVRDAVDTRYGPQEYERQETLGVQRERRRGTY